MMATSEELERYRREFERNLVQDRRAAALQAFTLAMLYADQSAAAFKEWSDICLHLLDGQEETLAEATAHPPELWGVQLPEYFHAGTVRQRFEAAAAKLGQRHLAA